VDGEKVGGQNSTTPASRWVTVRSALIVAVGLWTAVGGTVTSGHAGERVASRAPIERDGLATADEAPRSCAQIFHKRLQTVVAPLTGRIWPTALNLREPDETLPGYWLFWDGSGVAAKTARQKRLLSGTVYLERENRVCAQSVLARGGRIRCLKWRDVPDDYEPPPAKTPPDAADKPRISDGERAIAAAISRRVSSKGALDELAFGTAFYHLVKRTADELDRYASQDFKAQICAGAPEMAAFYRVRLAPLEKREAAARDRAATALESALEAQDEAARAFGLALMGDGEEGRDPIGIADVLKAALTPDENARIEGLEPDLELLTAAREMLSEERFAAIENVRREALRKALRTSELAIYAGLDADRVGQLHALFDSSLAAIVEAHRTSCTCAD
jgi:hypothetical protein